VCGKQQQLRLLLVTWLVISISISRRMQHRLLVGLPFFDCQPGSLFGQPMLLAKVLFSAHMCACTVSHCGAAVWWVSTCIGVCAMSLASGCCAARTSAAVRVCWPRQCCKDKEAEDCQLPTGVRAGSCCHGIWRALAPGFHCCPAACGARAHDQIQNPLCGSWHVYSAVAVVLGCGRQLGHIMYVAVG
jgi:hypothetical protein